ncbi:hypothetical protein [Halorussus salinisoli]|uniref:hypothetical protein n=1 Tax=Halorussus salinisoli TaxID=2558242 RepID=UPI0010C175B1|nr:hypothetical protein [Halorussus salinisoli]
MSTLLNTIYSAVILLVAVGGIAFVFYATGRDDSTDEDGGPEWTRWALGLVVAAFLAVMVGGLVV